MIDNFALFVFHAALMVLVIRLLWREDPDAAPPARRQDPRRPRTLR